MDYAKKEHVPHWFRHPIIGDVSFDSFERFEGNPVFTGIGVWEWPVNGFLFIDPVSGHFYVFVSLYARGYFPIGTVVLLRSADEGKTWDHLGPVFDGKGLSPEYDAGGAVDVSVVYEEGKYHMIYGWATSGMYADGGLAYASADRPEGPYYRHAHPVVSESGLGRCVNRYYKRCYAPTLLRRRHDWLLLTDMSTPGNRGGTWGMAALTSERPEGPYTGPELLLYPQSLKYHPAPIEFYPAFVDEEYVYAPATSVGENRNYQCLFRAPLEEAHLDYAWEIVQEGSLWHNELLSGERYGIWGQTFSGQVLGNRLWVMYPSKNGDDRGTINIASRSWVNPQTDGFVLSANNAPAFSFLFQQFTEFDLCIRLSRQADFSLLWQWNAPVGGTIGSHTIGNEQHSNWAGGQPHPMMLTRGLRLHVAAQSVMIEELDAGGNRCRLAEWPLADGWCEEIRVRQQADSCRIVCGGQEADLPLPAIPGRIGLHAEQGSVLEVARFCLEGAGNPCWIDLLPAEGAMCAGQQPGKWAYEESSDYKYGFGFRSTDRLNYDLDGQAQLKWNFTGTACRIWSPVLEACKLQIDIDGEQSEVVDVQPEASPGSRIIYERADLQERAHAVTVTLLEGELRGDVFSYLTGKGASRC
ncbi:hypothetical protein [Paenibacillus sp. GCM10027626]|uniref:hypothetical protein n=1 Tax=Paenibacillus sp. GCM10027626 TaxID=3273411 RepID=UPI003639D49F